MRGKTKHKNEEKKTTKQKGGGKDSKSEEGKILEKNTKGRTAFRF